MDMIERRIREAVATVLSRGAKALEQTAGELERAAEELRTELRQEGSEPEQAWSESRREADTITRSAPLRAVPDTPTDERTVPPVRPPRMPGGPRVGRIDAEIDTAAGPVDAEGSEAGAPESDLEPAGLRDLASGTVSEIRAQLDDLSADQLHGLRDIETANRNRVTLLTAIDRVLEQRG